MFYEVHRVFDSVCPLSSRAPTDEVIKTMMTWKYLKKLWKSTSFVGRREKHVLSMLLLLNYFFGMHLFIYAFYIYLHVLFYLYEVSWLLVNLSDLLKKKL